MLREPLLHFLLAGAILFGLHAFFSRESNESGREIVVTAAVRDEIAAQLERELGEAPGADQLEAAVRAWVDDEILYREGLARGFDRHDPALRSRIARKMLGVLASQTVVSQPTDEQLTAFYGEHADRYADVARTDFIHVFVSGSDAPALARAESILAQLRSGASPNGLGDTFSGGRRYRARATADLTATFGEEFTRDLDTTPPGEWSLRRSRFGIHLVRIDRRTEARGADFARAKNDVLHDWLDAERDRGVARELERIRAAWVVR